MMACTYWLEIRHKAYVALLPGKLSRCSLDKGQMRLDSQSGRDNKKISAYCELSGL
jgi:hypothetical protein